MFINYKNLIIFLKFLSLLLHYIHFNFIHLFTSSFVASMVADYFYRMRIISILLRSELLNDNFSYVVGLVNLIDIPVSFGL